MPQGNIKSHNCDIFFTVATLYFPIVTLHLTKLLNFAVVIFLSLSCSYSFIFPNCDFTSHIVTLNLII